MALLASDWLTRRYFFKGPVKRVLIGYIENKKRSRAPQTMSEEVPFEPVAGQKRQKRSCILCEECPWS